MNKFEWFKFADGGPTRTEALRGVWIFNADAQVPISWLEYDSVGYDPTKQGYTHFSYYPKPEFPKS